MENIIQLYAFSHDIGVLSSRLPVAVDLLRSSGYLQSLVVGDGDRELVARFDRWISRVSQLLSDHRDPVKFQCGVELMLVTLEQIPSQCGPYLRAWCCDINSVLASTLSSSNLVAIHALYSCAFGKRELVRDVANDQLPVTVLAIVKYLESSPNVSSHVLSSISALLTECMVHCASLVRPFVPKLQSLLLGAVSSTNSLTDIETGYALVASLCSAVGKQKCPDIHASLVRRCLASIQSLLDNLLSAVDEDKYRSVGDGSVALVAGPELSADYVQSYPVIVNSLERSLVGLLALLRVRLVAAASVPVSEIFDLLRRVFSVAPSSSVFRGVGDRDAFDLALLLLPRVHSLFLSFSTGFLRIIGRRCLRYRSTVCCAVELMATEYHLSSLVMRLIFVHVQTSLKYMDHVYASRIVSFLLPHLAEAATWKLTDAQPMILEVEQKSASSSRKRKHASLASDIVSIQSSAAVNNALSVEAVKCLSIIACLYSHVVHSRNWSCIDRAVAANILNGHKLGQGQSEMEMDALVECRRYIQTRAKFGHTGSDLVPFLMSISHWHEDKATRDDSAVYIRPKRPFIARRNVVPDEEAVAEVLLTDEHQHEIDAPTETLTPVEVEKDDVEAYPIQEITVVEHEDSPTVAHLAADISAPMATEREIAIPDMWKEISVVHKTIPAAMTLDVKVEEESDSDLEGILIVDTAPDQ